MRCEDVKKCNNSKICRRCRKSI